MRSYLYVFISYHTKEVERAEIGILFSVYYYRSTRYSAIERSLLQHRNIQTCVLYAKSSLNLATNRFY